MQFADGETDVGLSNFSIEQDGVSHFGVRHRRELTVARFDCEPPFFGRRDAVDCVPFVSHLVSFRRFDLRDEFSGLN
jgi:hypothetical protein